jgi:hypothetical protein
MPPTVQLDADTAVSCFLYDPVVVDAPSKLVAKVSA